MKQVQKGKAKKLQEWRRTTSVQIILCHCLDFFISYRFPNLSVLCVLLDNDSLLRNTFINIPYDLMKKNFNSYIYYMPMSTFILFSLYMQH